MVGGVSDVRTCNTCHVPVMSLFTLAVPNCHNNTPTLLIGYFLGCHWELATAAKSSWGGTEATVHSCPKKGPLCCGGLPSMHSLSPTECLGLQTHSHSHLGNRKSKEGGREGGEGGVERRGTRRREGEERDKREGK